MGKVALVLVAIASFIGMFISVGTRDNLIGAGEQVADHQHQILARTAAVAAHNRAVQRLAESFQGQQYGDTYDGIPYATTITLPTATRAVVHSVATSHNAAGEPVRFNIRAVFERIETPSGIAEEAPDFMSYAVLSEDNLQMNGNIDADICEICVEGDEEVTLNANMHTNGNLHVQGNSAEVRGFGTHVGSGTSNPNKALRRTFDPHYNPMGSPSTQQTPAIDIPNFSVDAMATVLSPDSVTNGNVLLTGDYNLGGSREDPYVWHVKGDLTASGGAELSGYVLFLIEGDVDFTGNLSVGSTSWSGPDESSVAFYVAGEVEFGGNVGVWGQILSQGDIWFHGTPDVYGSLTTQGMVHFSGAVDIFYRRASPALTTYWNPDTITRLRRLAYSEW